MTPDVPPNVPAAAPGTPPQAKGGFAVPEYSARVWDMARNLIHPTAFYVVIAVAGGARLLAHPVLDEPGAGGLIEIGLFLCAFLGAWGCFYSTLLRDAGLASRTITVLPVLAAVVAAALWLGVPDPAALSAPAFAWSSAALVGPGPVGWAVTMIAWRRHRAEQAAILAAPR